MERGPYLRDLPAAQWALIEPMTVWMQGRVARSATGVRGT